jgi:hypothetical protein
MPQHRFTTKDVLSLIESADGDYNDGLNAHVSAFAHNDHMHVELTPAVEHGEILMGTERFRVTVERIGETAPPRGLAAHLRDAGHRSLADAVERIGGDQ